MAIRFWVEGYLALHFYKKHEHFSEVGNFSDFHCLNHHKPRSLDGATAAIGNPVFSKFAHSGDEEEEENINYRERTNLEKTGFPIAPTPP